MISSLFNCNLSIHAQKLVLCFLNLPFIMDIFLCKSNTFLPFHKGNMYQIPRSPWYTASSASLMTAPSCSMSSGCWYAACIARWAGLPVTHWWWLRYSMENSPVKKDFCQICQSQVECQRIRGCSSWNIVYIFSLYTNIRHPFLVRNTLHDLISCLEYSLGYRHL